MTNIVLPTNALIHSICLLLLYITLCQILNGLHWAAVILSVLTVLVPKHSMGTGSYSQKDLKSHMAWDRGTDIVGGGTWVYWLSGRCVRTKISRWSVCGSWHPAALLPSVQTQLLSLAINTPRSWHWKVFPSDFIELKIATAKDESDFLSFTKTMGYCWVHHSAWLLPTLSYPCHRFPGTLPTEAPAPPPFSSCTLPFCLSFLLTERHWEKTEEDQYATYHYPLPPKKKLAKYLLK